MNDNYQTLANSLFQITQQHRGIKKNTFMLRVSGHGDIPMVTAHTLSTLLFNSLFFIFNWYVSMSMSNVVYEMHQTHSCHTTSVTYLSRTQPSPWNTIQTALHARTLWHFALPLGVGISSTWRWNASHRVPQCLLKRRSITHDPHCLFFSSALRPCFWNSDAI